MKDIQQEEILMREMQVKTIIRYHYTPDRMAKIKTSDITKRWQGCGESRSLTHTFLVGL